MLDRCKNAALIEHRGKLNKRLTLSVAARAEVLWWRKYDNEDPASILKPPTTHVLTTDASAAGWGAVLDRTTTQGRWSLKEQDSHINTPDDQY